LDFLIKQIIFSSKLELLICQYQEPQGDKTTMDKKEEVKKDQVVFENCYLCGCYLNPSETGTCYYCEHPLPVLGIWGQYRDSGPLWSMNPNPIWDDPNNNNQTGN
jgi:hypothetical protein